MSKRANGDGSVFFRKKRQSWCAQLSINGKPVVRYAKTKVEASKKLQDLRNERDFGMLAMVGKTTVAEWSVEWLNRKKPDLKATTLVRYEHDIRVNIIPLIGQIKLVDLHRSDVAKIHTTLLDQGKKANTIRHAHRVISGMLRDAMRSDMIRRNVASLVQPPKIPTRSFNILDQDESRRLINVLFNIQDRTLIELALSTGMRSGEILALRWQDIDFIENCISIDNTISFPGGGSHVLTSPKTKSSRRKITFQKTIAKEMNELRQYQDHRREMAGDKWHEYGFVFCNDFGRPLTQNGMPRKVLYPALKRAGVKRIRFHDLRHTCFSHMVARGVAITDISVTAGHANVSTTMSLYAHPLPGASNRATSAMEDFLTGTG